MGLAMVRPGFRHVRVCVECDDRIAEDGGCKCSAPSPFKRGAYVTVCSDAAGEIPIRVEQIGRIGNGAFRLAGRASWYALDGSPQSGSDGTWCRITRETDASTIDARVRAESRAKRLADEERWLSNEVRDLKGKKAVADMHAYEGRRYAYSALKIDPAAEGEKGRIAAERTAVEAIYYCLFEEADQRRLAAKATESVQMAEERIARYQASIAKIKAEE